MIESTDHLLVLAQTIFKRVEAPGYLEHNPEMALEEVKYARGLLDRWLNAEIKDRERLTWKKQ